MSASNAPQPRPRPHTHGLRAMVGRDPNDSQRTATPLELLYDLVFVISFGVAGNEFAHLVANGYWVEGLIGFGFAMFAVVWAWINFTWFASAFDVDDWLYRLLVMVQMIGVVILALGLPAMFVSIHHHQPFDNAAMVWGYIIMRVPMIALWVRVGVQDPNNARNAKIYAVTLTVVQVGWCLSLLLNTAALSTLLIVSPLFLIELVGPAIAERQKGGTPWHAHHIAERYGLLAIISFGEILIGTVAALQAVIEANAGWTIDVGLLAVFGVALAFGLWWLYFNIPVGEALSVFRERSFGWGYGHIIVYAAIAAIGAGLHVGALYLEHEATVTETTVMIAIALPVAVYVASAQLLFSRLVSFVGPAWLPLLTKLGLCLAAILMVDAGVSFISGLGLLLLVPLISIVAQENGVGEAHDGQLDALVASN